MKIPPSYSLYLCDTNLYNEWIFIMKKVQLFLASLPLALSVACGTTNELVFEDDFEGTGLPDSLRWNYEEGYVRNGELQYYTVARPENCYRQDGYLHIVVRRDSAVIENGLFAKQWETPVDTTRSTAVAPITSASITTKGLAEWKYCRVEVRAKLPDGIGTWPAIWMMPADDTYGEWPKSGEMDIMENVGYELPKVHYAIHTEKYNHTKNNQKRHTVDCATVATDFHVYGFEGREDKLTWYLDGVKTYSVTKDENGWEAWPFDRPFYLILNFAFGGGWGGSQGVDLDALPQEYIIDYVRVYR